MFRSHVVLEWWSTFQLPSQEDSALSSTDNTEALDRPQRMSLAPEATSLACTDLDTVMEPMDRSSIVRFLKQIGPVVMW